MSDKAIFFDRDNTLIDDPGYINSPDQVKLLEGVPEALIELRHLGYKLVVTTNQSAVARGIITEEVLGTIHARLEELLSARGAHLDRIYYCPYHMDGVVAKYRKDSDWRKPNPGMLLKASRDMDLDVTQSWCVGDRQSDIEAGHRAGCRTILVDLMSPVGRLRPEQIHPDYIAVNIREATNIIKKHRQTPTPVKETVNTSIAPAGGGASGQAVTRQASAPSSAAPKKVDARLDTENAQAGPPTPKPNSPVPVPDTPSQTEQLLLGIHEQLKSMQREDLFDDFSVVRLVGGIAQIGVFFCLLIAVWFLLSPDRPTDPIFLSLGFALVLQVMSLTFAMHGRS